MSDKKSIKKPTPRITFSQIFDWLVKKQTNLYQFHQEHDFFIQEGV